MTSAPPDTFRVIEISSPGDPEVLVSRPRRQLVPMPDEVLIKVMAAGVNRPDVLQRRGFYPPPPGASDIPGLEVSGMVMSVGSSVTHVQPGDAVCALLTGGGYGEYCIASAALCLPVPTGLSWLEAAAIPETFFTVWSNVFERAKIKSGESLLVHGGASGIGTTAIQLASALGVTVYATVGSDVKFQACQALGARCINYRTQDFVAAIDEFTHGNGVDVILDIIGGDYLQRNLACLAAEGRLLQIALQQGVKAEVNLLPVLLKRLTITGATLRSRSVAEKASIARAMRETVWPLLESGRIRPMVFAHFPLDQAACAHRMMESGCHIGKIVLQVA